MSVHVPAINLVTLLSDMNRVSSNLGQLLAPAWFTSGTRWRFSATQTKVHRISERRGWQAGDHNIALAVLHEIISNAMVGHTGNPDFPLRISQKREGRVVAAGTLRYGEERRPTIR